MKPGPGVNLYRRTRQVPGSPVEISSGAGGSFSPDHGSYNVTAANLNRLMRLLFRFRRHVLAWCVVGAGGATQWQLSAQTDRQLGRTVPFHRQMIAIRILPLSVVDTPQAPS
jgi:hypothetical protein